MNSPGEDGELLVLRSVAEVLSARDEWDAACRSRDADLDMFLLVLGKESKAGRPHALLIRRPGRPSALVAARLERLRVEARLGPLRLPTPALRVITVISPAPDMTEEEANAALRELKASLDRGEADAVRLHYTSVSHPLYRLMASFPSAMMRDRAAVPMAHRIRAVTTEQNFMASISRNERSNQRRRERALETKFDGAVEIAALFSIDDLPQLLEDAEAVARTSYQRRIGVGFAATDAVRARLELMATKGWLRAWVLRLGGKPAAFWIGAQKHETFVSDYLSFDPEYTALSPGTYLIMKVLEWMHDTPSGVQRVAFGAGDAAYKERFGTSVDDVATLYLFRARPLPLLANLMRTGAAATTRKLRASLEASGKLAAARRFFRRQSLVRSG